MPKKSKYPSTELTTSQRELVARIIGPMEARGIKRSVFRDTLSDAEFTVPKLSFVCCVTTTVSMLTIFLRDWIR
ncbi:hypothetical protein CCP4SC76_4150003 [Gammaproteobacteria bacterium]